MKEIVIKIPDEDYTVLEKWFRLENLNGTLEQRLFCAVANGTVLPKGHGDLIDRSKLETHYVGTELGTDLEVYLKPTVEYADVVIPADKESGDANSN